MNKKMKKKKIQISVSFVDLVILKHALKQLVSTDVRVHKFCGLKYPYYESSKDTLELYKYIVEKLKQNR